MEQFDEYKNVDGTYTSPKNNKTYKSLKAFKSHWYNNGTGGWKKVNSTLKACQYCNELISSGNIARHEDGCYLNVKNTKLCVVCNGPIKNYKASKGTCSRSCANTHFRSGSDNGAWGGKNYQIICFTHHQKKCIVCGEEKIVAVHHNDHNHYNNSPENLIPLCPTHHQYVHSKYRDEVQKVIDNYIKRWLNTSK